MIGLINKEWISMRYYLLFVLGYCIFFALYINSSMGLMVLICFPPVMMAIYSSSIEVRSKSQMFTGSLPVSRTLIVTSKYVIGGLYTLVGLSTAIGLFYLFPLLSLKQELSVSSVFFGLTTSAIFLSIYLPLQFWLGLRSSNILSFLVIMILVIGMGTYNSLLERALIPDDALEMINLVMPLIVLIFLACSYFLSMALFRNKDMES